MVLRGIYNQPPRTTRTPAKVSHFDDPVPEHVDYLGLTPAHYPLALRPVEVNVPVQPQGGLVAVYKPEEGLEAYVGLVLGVAEAERRGVGDEYARCRTSGEHAPQDAGRERPGPAAHLALRVLVRAARVQSGAGEPGENHSGGFYDPAVEWRAARRVFRPVGRGVVVAENVIDGHAEEGDDVVKVVERQVAAGTHGLHLSSVRREARPVEHRLNPVADAQDLHVRRSITSFGGAGTLRCAGRG